METVQYMNIGQQTHNFQGTAQQSVNSVLQTHIYGTHNTPGYSAPFESEQKLLQRILMIIKLFAITPEPLKNATVYYPTWLLVLSFRWRKF